MECGIAKGKGEAVRQREREGTVVLGQTWYWGALSVFS